MAHSGDKPRMRWRLIAVSAAVLLVVTLAIWVVHTAGFRSWVRGRVVARLEQMTGGRVELGSLTWTLSKLEFEARDLTIHGLERPGEIPYAHLDRLLLRARIVSLLRRQIGLRYLELDGPVVHLIIYPDGTTNQPVPKTGEALADINELFDLAVDHTEVHDALILVNDRPIPLGVTADQITLTLSYIRREGRYAGDLRFNRLQTRYISLAGISATGAARFSLQRDHARLEALDISSGKTHLSANGELRNFRQPVFDLSYDGNVDVVQLAPMLSIPGMRAGVLKIAGHASGNRFDYDAKGKVAVRGLDYYRPEVKVSSLSGGADYAFGAGTKRLTFSNMFISMLGGTVLGEAEFFSAGRGSTGGQRASEPGGSISLRLRGLLVSRLIDAISTRSMPLNRIRMVGAVSGSVNARWRRSTTTLFAAASLDLAGPEQFAPGELPVNGHVQGSYDCAKHILRLPEVRLATHATELRGHGVLGTETEKLHLLVTTHDLGEWKPLLATLGGPTLPLEVHGRASFDGTATGPISTPALAGRLQAFDFDSLVSARLNQSIGDGLQVASRRFHWDTLNAWIGYSTREALVRDAVLKRGSSQVNFDLVAGLQSGKFGDDLPFTLQANIRDAEVGDLLQLAGYEQPVSGRFNARLKASGTMADPHGAGNVLVTDANAYGEPVQRFSTDIAFAQHEAQFLAITIAQDGGRVTGDAGYNLVNGAYHFNLRGLNFNLAKLRRLQSRRTSVAGSLNFVAAGHGTADAPAINAEMHLRDVVLNGERFGRLDASAVTVGDKLQFKARSDFEHADIDLNGSARLRGDFPAQVDMRFNHLDIDPLLHMLMKGKVTGHSVLAGAAKVTGSLRSPGDLTLAANIDSFSADVEHIQLHNEGPIRFVVAQRVLRVQQLRIAGLDTTLAATGSVQLSESHALDLDAKGHVNLKLLATLDPGIVSYGLLTLDMRVGGTMARPLMAGQVAIANAGISHVDLPNGLSDLNGRLVFTEDRLQVQNLTAKTGGGTLAIGGFVLYGRALAFNLTGKGHEIRFRYPPGVSAVADADLRLTGDPQSALLSGDVTVTRFGVNPAFDFSTYLAKAKQQGPAPNVSPWLSRLRLDIHIISPPELHVQTSLAKISGDVDLRLRGTAARPVLLGRVNIIEGDIYFNATKYHLERGSVVFPNPVTIQPVLDMEATTTVRDYDITLGFHGPLDKLSTTYRSDPPLATADIVSLLAFGRTREETAAQASLGRSNLAPETQTVLYQALNAAVSSRMQKLFGVSRIKIDPQAGGAENNAIGPRLTIEQQVANNITLTYITDVGHTNYQTIQAEYNINRSVSVVAVRDWNGIVSFDIRIRQRKR